MTYRYCNYVHVIYENVHYAVPEDWEHPGGQDDILNARGTDITDDFDAVGHSRDALNQLKGFGTIAVTHEGAEYLINVNWLATSEAMKASGDYNDKNGHFQRFLEVLHKGEEETSKLINNTWPEEAKSHMKKHFKLPGTKKADATANAATEVSPASAPAATVTVEAPAKGSEMKEDSSSRKADARTEDVKCPCANPRFIGALAAFGVVLFIANKYLAKRK